MDDGKGLNQFTIHLGGQSQRIRQVGGIDRLHVHLIASALHVDEAAIPAVEELRVTPWSGTLLDGLFKLEALGGR